VNVIEALTAAIDAGTATPIRNYRLDRDEFGVTVTWEAPEPGASGSFTRPDYDEHMTTMVAALRRNGFGAVA
jgi:hypothetical protein